MTQRAQVKNWADRLAGAKMALGELHALDRQIREAHAAAKAELQRIANLPAPLDEIIVNMEHVVDQHAAPKLAEEAYSLRAAFSGGFELRKDGTRVERRPAMPEHFYTRELTVIRLAVLFPDLVKARFREILSSVPYDAGAPMRDRPQLLAEAEARVEELERQHEDLVEEAARLDPPVAVASLPENKARKEAEAVRLQRDERARQAREEAKARADAAAAAQPRAARSPYVEGVEGQ